MARAGIPAARGMTLVYGGGSVGLMKIAAEAALAANGGVIGVPSTKCGAVTGISCSRPGRKPVVSSMKMMGML